MKKIVLMVMMVSLLFAIPVFAVETAATPTTPPVTIAKPTEIKINQATNPNGCPMFNNGMQSCPMLQGGSPGMMNPGKGKFLFKRMGNNVGYKKIGVNSCQGPRFFRWIGMGIKLIVCLLFWIFIIILLVMGIKWLMKPHHHFMNCCQNDSAMAILKERYAKGEITAEEFEAMKAKLS